MHPDEPTQQLRRTPPQAPLPGPLNPAGRTDTESSEPTAVLGLDELFEAQNPVQEARAVPAYEPAPAPAVTPTPAPVPTYDAAAAPSYPLADPTPLAPPVASAAPYPVATAARLRTDASIAARDTAERLQGWLRAGDNAVIAATIAIAVLLLLAVALL